jgi:hypothetical protein
MSYAIIPWEPCNIPDEIQSELNRRKINRSFNYIDGEKGEWDNANGEWNKYRGPMSPWVRVCSNGKGREKDGKEGFIFFSGKDFYTGYGFNNSENGPSVIGYVPSSGKYGVHTIDNDLGKSDYPIHVPAPEIEKIQVTIQKEHFRRATIDWVCFSKKQLEYMTPYFLVPGISCIMEWGWNHYDPTSLLDLTDTQLLERIWSNPYPLYTKHILKSRGNYDVIFGIITHFEWSIDGLKIRCKTEVTSKDRIYSGLVVDCGIVEEKKDVGVKPFGGLPEFFKNVLVKFKEVNINKNPYEIPELNKFVSYIAKKYPKNWNDYVYGIFYGRDLKDKGSAIQDKPNKDYDFDHKKKNEELWLNLGLVLEAINFHSAGLRTVNDNQMFNIDIDDVVIGSHPNLISTNGSVCLIPNDIAPKYFCGDKGPQFAKNSNNFNIGDFDKLKPCSLKKPLLLKSVAQNKAKTGDDKIALADYRLRTVCYQPAAIYRDNIDEIINSVRYANSNTDNTFEFPFNKDMSSPGDKPYPSRYSGYLKNIYVNHKFLVGLLDKSDEIKTYYKFIEKILEGINISCGNFWDFRIIDSTGDYKLPETKAAPMKIVDYKFMHFSNRGTVYTFDYYDADSLLLGLNFKPTLSNAAAIRSLYAPTNNPDSVVKLTNGSNELLDYQFKDRLKLAQEIKGTTPSKDNPSTNYDTTLGLLQQLKPPEGSYQITNGDLIRRLVLPNTEILAFLLDDEDEENNPKYTGIMPHIQASFTIQGIGGLRTFMMFLVRNLPEPYSHKNIVFRIVDVQETIEAGKWITNITAGIVPLRGFIKKRLGINT